MKVGDKVRYVKSISEVHPTYKSIGTTEQFGVSIAVGWESTVLNIYFKPGEELADGLDLSYKEDEKLFPWIRLENPGSLPACSPMQCLEVIDQAKISIPCNCDRWQVVNFGCKNENHW